MVICLSSGRYQAAPRALPRGTIVTFTRGLAYCRNQLTVACPASCMAMLCRSSSVVILFFFSRPPTTRSMAFMKSSRETNSFSARAAIRAASLQMLAISAPEKPGVRRASRSTSTLSSSLSGRRCTRKISLRSFTSGMSTYIWRSKRPARRSAESSISALLVAASTMIPLLVLKPSISVRS